MSTQCLVLAGGVARRMRPLTETIPKCLLPVADTVFLDIQLDWLIRTGVTDIILSLGYLASMVEEHLEKHPRPGTRIRVLNEGEKLLGTGGALRFALDKDVLHDSFLVTYGDTLLPVDFGGVMRVFRESGHPALLTILKNENRWDTSNVWFENGKLVRYDKSQASIPKEKLTHIDYGLMALSRDVVARIPSGKTYDLSQLLLDLSVENKLQGLEIANRFYEIGSPTGFKELNELWVREEFRNGLTRGLPGFNAQFGAR